MSTDTSALREECAELEEFLKLLPDEAWRRQTEFYGWTVADEVMHLHQVDGFGLVAVQSPDAFPELVSRVREHQGRGIELSAKMREQWGDLSPAELFSLWHEGWTSLADCLDGCAPESKLPWFGPPMKVSSFVGARQMEVWAHGQDIYDLQGVRRYNSDRIRAICELGVRTQGWSFANRKLDRPEPPEVRLISPSGKEWRWNDGAAERISGLAEDFALVVTQRRNVADTALNVQGKGAETWMTIAQCFAGAPADGPAPGERVNPS